MSSDSDYSDDDSGDDSRYECCSRRRSSAIGLPFDPTSIENIILTISDRFNFRVMMSTERAKRAMVVTTGLAIAGGLIGRAYWGRMGAAVGGAVGGACGIGLVAISMRDIWEDIKPQLSEIFDIVYDYLSGLGIEDYSKAARYLATNSSTVTSLAMIILESSSAILGHKVLSSLTAA